MTNLFVNEVGNSEVGVSVANTKTFMSLQLFLQHVFEKCGRKFFHEDLLVVHLKTHEEKIRKYSYKYMVFVLV